MSILQINTQFAGEVDVHPQIVRIVSTDNFSEITSPGYLDDVVKQGYEIDASDLVIISYDNPERFNSFIPSISNDVITLIQSSQFDFFPGTNISFLINPVNGQITLSAAGGGGLLPWTDVAGLSYSMSIDHGYTSSNASLVTLTLPAVSIYGSIIRVVGIGAGGWKIAQNAGQVIHSNNGDTTVGIAGSLSSTNRYDCVDLFCSAMSTDWIITASNAKNLIAL